MDIYGLYCLIYERCKKAEVLTRVIETNVNDFSIQPYQIKDMETIQYLVYTLSEQVKILSDQLESMETMVRET